MQLGCMSAVLGFVVYFKRNERIHGEDELLFRHVAVDDLKNKLTNKGRIRDRQHVAVEIQERYGGNEAGSLVALLEWMVLADTEEERGGEVKDIFLAAVIVMPARSLDRAIQKIGISEEMRLVRYSNGHLVGADYEIRVEPERLILQDGREPSGSGS